MTWVRGKCLADQACGHLPRFCAMPRNWLKTRLRANSAMYAFIEVNVACPGGCVWMAAAMKCRIKRKIPSACQNQAAGPLSHGSPAAARRLSHNNPQIGKMYGDYLGEFQARTCRPRPAAYLLFQQKEGSQPDNRENEGKAYVNGLNMGFSFTRKASAGGPFRMVCSFCQPS